MVPGTVLLQRIYTRALSLCRMQNFASQAGRFLRRQFFNAVLWSSVSLTEPFGSPCLLPLCGVFRVHLEPLSTVTTLSPFPLASSGFLKILHSTKNPPFRAGLQKAFWFSEATRHTPTMRAWRDTRSGGNLVSDLMCASLNLVDGYGSRQVSSIVFSAGRSGRMLRSIVCHAP